MHFACPGDYQSIRLTRILLTGICKLFSDIRLHNFDVSLILEPGVMDTRRIIDSVSFCLQD